MLGLSSLFYSHHLVGSDMWSGSQAGWTGPEQRTTDTTDYLPTTAPHLPLQRYTHVTARTVACRTFAISFFHRPPRVLHCYTLRMDSRLGFILRLTTACTHAFTFVDYPYVRFGYYRSTPFCYFPSRTFTTRTFAHTSVTSTNGDSCWFTFSTTGPH